MNRAFFPVLVLCVSNAWAGPFDGQSEYWKENNCRVLNGELVSVRSLVCLTGLVTMISSNGVRLAVIESKKLIVPEEYHEPTSSQLAGQMAARQRWDSTHEPTGGISLGAPPHIGGYRTPPHTRTLIVDPPRQIFVVFPGSKVVMGQRVRFLGRRDGLYEEADPQNPSGLLHFERYVASTAYIRTNLISTNLPAVTANKP